MQRSYSASAVRLITLQQPQLDTFSSQGSAEGGKGHEKRTRSIRALSNVIGGMFKRGNSAQSNGSSTGGNDGTDADSTVHRGASDLFIRGSSKRAMVVAVPLEEGPYDSPMGIEMRIRHVEGGAMSKLLEKLANVSLLAHNVCRWN